MKNNRRHQFCKSLTIYRIFTCSVHSHDQSVLQGQHFAAGVKSCLPVLLSAQLLGLIGSAASIPVGDCDVRCAITNGKSQRVCLVQYGETT